ncbi:MAG: pyruvate kinase, partial [Candidatus Dormibacteraceae bacterium]
MRRTRIVCTLGPSSTQVGVLRRMITAGMDVARLNFSHGDEETHRRTVQMVREAASATGRHIALMQDLQGPKIRTGRLAHPLVRLVRGSQVTLTSRDLVGDESLVSVDQPVVLQELRPRDRVLLVDGQIELRVAGSDGVDARCQVVRAG